MDLLSFCDFTNYFFLSLWIHHLILKIHYLFVNIQRIHDLFRGFTMKLLYFPWIHYIFTIYFANLLWIHYRLGEFTTHPVSGPWIHCLLHKYTMNSPSFTRIHYNFLSLRLDTMNLLSILRTQDEFTIFFAKMQWIHFISFPLLQYQFTVCFANSLSIPRIHYEYTINLDSLSISWKYHELTICFAITL